jgi:hypothetical protein
MSALTRRAQPLFRFMGPLFLVYYAEYAINQGLCPNITFDGIWLSTKGQYRWYSAVYQIGVFVSRSSIVLFHVPYLWAMAWLQVANFVLLLCDAHFQFITGSIWIIFAIILWEGLLGGGIYVNAFYRITQVCISLHMASLAHPSHQRVAGVRRTYPHRIASTAWASHRWQVRLPKSGRPVQCALTCVHATDTIGIALAGATAVGLNKWLDDSPPR